MLILNFLTALEAELEDKGLIVRSAFFEAAFDVFDLVIRQSISEYGNAKVESLRKAIRPVAKFDYSGSISNKGALKQTMLAALESTLKLTDDML